MPSDSAPDDQADDPHAAKGPLAGIRVLELATVLMGPLGSQLLGDLGAEIIKVEGSKLDSSRVMGGGPHRELSGIALNIHRNKRSISLDLKTQRGKEIFLKLLAGSDVLITNLRPGPLARLGFDYEQLAVSHPGLIFCQAQGFSSDGGDADRPAYDDIIQAATGMPALNQAVLGTMGFFPSLIADKVAGLMISYGVLAALVHRERTGLGQCVEVPMFDAVLSFNLVEHLAKGTTPGEPAGYSRIMTKHRGPHATLDGYIAMMPYSDEHWQSLFGAVGREEILERPWFADHRSRLLEADRVYGDLAEVIAERTTEDWMRLCDEHGIPANRVPTLGEIVDDPALHRGVLVDAEHPVVGSYRQIKPAVTLSATPLSVRRPAPLVAEHTVEILAGLGYSREDIDGLIADRVVRTVKVPRAADPVSSEG